MSEDKELPKLKATIYTDGGSDNPGPSGWGVHTTVKGQMWNLGGPIKYATNNMAELKAAEKGIELASKLNVSDLVIKTDSTYTINCIKHVPNWENNGWLNHKGEPIKNKDYIESLYDVYKTNKDSGMKIRFKWVRGHAGNEGNEIADDCATRGKILARNNETEGFETVIDSDKPVKPKTPERNHMINCPRWFFMGSTGQLRSQDGRHVYHTGFSDKDDEYPGKPISDAYQSVVFLKEPEPVLDALRDYQDSLLGGANHPIIARVDNITKPVIYNELLEGGFRFLNVVGKFKNLTSHTKLPITRAARPPGLAYNLMELFRDLELKLEAYIAGELGEGTTYTDITTEIYDVNDNPKKTKILPSIDTSVKLLETSVTHFPDRPMKLTLTLGLDLPKRNALAKFSKLSPKVGILTWTESKSSFRYATIVETADDIGIYAAGYSNVRINPTK